ncbi:hypothetical protein PUN28_005760 [Cardiocondyla obscurior]|uniref:Uncharacterized protein n=1 Tax=Cardiocondyla obscurior TaxID=286306 RepID=A0AAW2G7G6_9HYME
MKPFRSVSVPRAASLPERSGPAVRELVRRLETRCIPRAPLFARRTSTRESE